MSMEREEGLLNALKGFKAKPSYSCNRRVCDGTKHAYCHESPGVALLRQLLYVSVKEIS